MDQCQPYIDKARQLLADTNARKFYCSGLQDFAFEETYDCIWVQWVLTHLNDEDNIAFLKKAQRHLRKGGVIVVKENASEKGFFVDKGDSSVVRSTLLWKVLFQQAGLRVLKEGLQTDWPEDLFEVRMYALQEME